MSSQFQSLSEQFNNLLTEYTETYNNYIKSLSTPGTFMTVPNSSFVTNNIINTEPNSSLINCQSACTNYSNKKCSGATFNSITENCTLNAGDGKIVNTPQSTAIVQDTMNYNIQLQSINNQLMALNKQMMTIADNTNTPNKSTISATAKQNYNTLLEERAQLEMMVREQETLNAAYENGNIIVTSNYYWYVILLITAIILIVVLVKVSYSGGSSSGSSSAMLQLGGGDSVRKGFKHLHTHRHVYIVGLLFGISIILGKILLTMNVGSMFNDLYWGMPSQ